MPHADWESSGPVARGWLLAARRAAPWQHQLDEEAAALPGKLLLPWHVFASLSSTFRITLSMNWTTQMQLAGHCVRRQALLGRMSLHVRDPHAVPFPHGHPRLCCDSKINCLA